MAECLAWQEPGASSLLKWGQDASHVLWEAPQTPLFSPFFITQATGLWASEATSQAWALQCCPYWCMSRKTSELEVEDALNSGSKLPGFSLGSVIYQLLSDSPMPSVPLIFSLTKW